MGYWGYGGGFGGYPWANGSAYANPWAGGPGYAGFNAPPVAPGAHHGAGHGEGNGETEHAEKPGGVKGFFKGIFQGAVNTVKGILSPKGILMLAGTAALGFLTGGLIFPVLGIVGLGASAYQFVKGVASGDTEKMGEGVFSLGLSTLGFLGPKTVTLKGAETGESATYTLAETDGLPGFLERVKAPFGLSKYVSDSGEDLNLYQLSWRKMQDRFSGFADWSAKWRQEHGGANKLSSGIAKIPTRDVKWATLEKRLNDLKKDRDALAQKLDDDPHSAKAGEWQRDLHECNAKIRRDLHVMMQTNISERTQNIYLKKAQKLEREEVSLQRQLKWAKTNKKAKIEADIEANRLRQQQLALEFQQVVKTKNERAMQYIEENFDDDEYVNQLREQYAEAEHSRGTSPHHLDGEDDDSLDTSSAHDEHESLLPKRRLNIVEGHEKRPQATTDTSSPSLLSRLRAGLQSVASAGWLSSGSGTSDAHE